MQIDVENKVIISTLSPPEARAYIKFLQSQIFRHLRDIAEAEDLIRTVRDKIDDRGE